MNHDFGKTLDEGLPSASTMGPTSTIFFIRRGLRPPVQRRQRPRPDTERKEGDPRVMGLGRVRRGGESASTANRRRQDGALGRRHGRAEGA